MALKTHFAQVNQPWKSSNPLKKSEMNMSVKPTLKGKCDHQLGAIERSPERIVPYSRIIAVHEEHNGRLSALCTTEVQSSAVFLLFKHFAPISHGTTGRFPPPKTRCGPEGWISFYIWDSDSICPSFKFSVPRQMSVIYSPGKAANLSLGNIILLLCQG